MAAELYLGQWELDVSEPLNPFWRAPGGNALGVLDLRSFVQCGQPGPTPQGFGLFAYATTQTHPLLQRALGSDLTRLLTSPQKSALRTAFGVAPSTSVEDRLGNAIRQIGQDSAFWDATGQTRWKP